ncbi:MAG TPA: signal peptidase I [Kofleriaceae bacterium]|nr:signal peptidase I [Kofleriaceae bacterium]
MGLNWLLVIVWTFFCPGAGQAVAGRRIAAFAWAVAGLVAVLALPLTLWAWHVVLAIRLGAVADAVVRVRRARVNQIKWSLPAGVATGALVIGIVYLRLFVHMFKIPASSMYPTVEIGDHILAERLTLQWRPLERGEIIVFQQPCQPDRDYIKRVIAVANDTIEIRCNVVYVNGAAIPNELVEGDTCEYRDRDDMRDEWFPRTCSRYRETLDGRSYEVFHDPDRPRRDEELRRTGRLAQGDSRDFPEPGAPLRSCATVPPMEGEAAPAQQPGRQVETKNAAGPCEPQLHFVVPPDSLFVLGDNRNNSNDSRYWGVVPVSYVRGRVVGRWYPFSRIGGI